MCPFPASNSVPLLLPSSILSSSTLFSQYPFCHHSTPYLPPFLLPHPSLLPPLSHYDETDVVQQRVHPLRGVVQLQANTHARDRPAGQAINTAPRRSQVPICRRHQTSVAGPGRAEPHAAVAGTSHTLLSWRWPGAALGTFPHGQVAGTLPSRRPPHGRWLAAWLPSPGSVTHVSGSLLGQTRRSVSVVSRYGVLLLRNGTDWPDHTVDTVCRRTAGEMPHYCFVLITKIHCKIRFFE